MSKKTRSKKFLSLVVICAGFTWLVYTPLGAMARQADTSSHSPLDGPVAANLEEVSRRAKDSGVRGGVEHVVSAIENGSIPPDIKGLVDDAQRLTVEVVTEFTEESSAISREIRLIDGELLGSVPGHLILAKIPVGHLRSLEKREDVQVVRLPTRVDIPQEPVLGEQVGTMNANQWQANGSTGAGVKIGIIDIFDQASWNAAQLAGEVPAYSGVYCRFAGLDCTSQFWSWRSPGEGKHGVAVAEIIHEMAPAAELYLVMVSTAADLQATVNYFLSNGVTVVNRSLGSAYDGPGDGTKSATTTVADYAANNGIAWFNAAGNRAGRDGQRGGYWRGQWVDANGDGWIEFAPGDHFLGVDCDFLYGLRWSDWGAVGTRTDYDAYLFDGDANRIGEWYADQLAGAPPIEQVTCPSGYQGSVVFLAIRLWDQGSGTAGDVLEFMTSGGVEYWSNPYSAAIAIVDSLNPGVAAVGAIDPWHGTTIAPYSSEGPTNDGRIKPDVSAPSCLSSYTYKPDCFAGTSASSPAAAGAAALVKSAIPALSPGQIVDYLRTNAEDHGAIGPDNLFGAGKVVLPPPASTPPPCGPCTFRANTTTSATQSDGPAHRASVSNDGTFVAFHSSAGDLVPGDTNGVGDVFVKTSATGETERVSVSSNGSQATGGPSIIPQITPDGRYVTYFSSATDLVPGDTNGVGDVFVRDRLLGFTERISVASDGSQANGASRFPQITPDGRYVTFMSEASNLVPGDTNGKWDIFVRDRVLGTTERVSISSSGFQADRASARPSISDDGRFVVFHSWATTLVVGDSNGVADVFMRDRQSAGTTRISVSSGGVQGNGESLFAKINGMGSVVVFHSVASNLVSGDTNAVRDVFVKVITSSVTQRVSLSTAGTEGNAISGFGSISSDGRYVAFHTQASNLVVGDTNATQDVLVRDRINGTTSRNSIAHDGNQSNNISGMSSISPDGNFVAYQSRASNLVTGDTNEAQDIFFGPRV